MTGVQTCALPILIDPAPVRSLANLTFVAALAVHDVIDDLLHAKAVGRHVSLKWPNDVLIEGRKVAGILLEHHTVEGRSAVIIGIGVNCRHHPDATLHPATSLLAQGIDASPADVFSGLACHFAALCRTWNRGEEFTAIRLAWLQYAVGLGKSVTLRVAKREVS